MSIIRVVDLETTGLEPPEHTVCEVGWVDLLSPPMGGWVLDPGASILVDPGRPIPPETSAVHHLTDEDVASGVSWRAAVASLTGGEIAAFAAHNAKFERQWITPELDGGRDWICTYKCAMRLWPEAPGHGNQCLRYFLNPPGLDRKIANVAHRAMPDAYVTAFLLREMLALARIEDLIDWSSHPALQFRCQFGKWRGTPWREVDSGFLRWVLDKDFDEDVVFTVRTELARRDAESRSQP